MLLLLALSLVPLVIAAPRARLEGRGDPSREAPPPPIVNGEATDDYPQAVMLRHATADWRAVFICTGTLIAPDVVLTAAHCLTDPDHLGLTELHVYMGTVWTPDAAERPADDWQTHPDYAVSPDGATIQSDMGIVHLAEPYDLDGEVLNAQPITDADIGRSFRYVGWGSSGDTANDAGYVKRVADIPMIGTEGEFILGYDGERGSATCGGDSGGPVFGLRDGVVSALAAVHSFGRDDDGTLCAGSISGDTRVDLYLDWIATFADVETDAVDPSGDDTGDTGGQDTGRDDHTGVGETEEDKGGCASARAPVTIQLIVAGMLVARRGRRPVG